jgi:hypothetical protein
MKEMGLIDNREGAHSPYQLLSQESQEAPEISKAIMSGMHQSEEPLRRCNISALLKM